MPHVNQLDCCQNCCQDHDQLPDARRQAWNVGPEDSRCSTVPDDLPMTTDQKVGVGVPEGRELPMNEEQVIPFAWTRQGQASRRIEPDTATSHSVLKEWQT